MPRKSTPATVESVLGYTPVDDKADIVIVIEVRVPLLDMVKYGEPEIEQTLEQLRGVGSAEILSIGVSIPKVE